jgi:hypothetical protein
MQEGRRRGLYDFDRSPLTTENVVFFVKHWDKRGWMSGDFLAEFLVIFGHGVALGKGKEKSLVKSHVEVQLSFFCTILRYPHSWMENIPGFSQSIIRAAGG